MSDNLIGIYFDTLMPKLAKHKANYHGVCRECKGRSPCDAEDAHKFMETVAPPVINMMVSGPKIIQEKNQLREGLKRSLLVVHVLKGRLGELGPNHNRATCETCAKYDSAIDTLREELAKEKGDE